MTESQQSKRGWFRGWREQRRATRQDRVERARFEHEQATEVGMYHRSSPYQHAGSATYFGGGGGGFGGDGGGGCGGDGGGGC